MFGCLCHVGGVAVAAAAAGAGICGVGVSRSCYNALAEGTGLLPDAGQH